jgi:DNA-binding transcriptional ArsR family regulator
MDALGTVLLALSDPTRRAIIARLAAGPARVTDIAEPFSVSLNAVSKHLKVLERAGLIRRARRGRDHILTFEGKPLRDVVRWAHMYERFWNQRLSRLEAFFTDKGRRK